MRTDGFLTVPLLGDVFAVGKTPRGLAAELGQQLGQLVTSPVVTVTLVYSSALRFFVVGQVTKAGEFPLLGRTTVMQALALAGGFQEYAKTDEIRILRQELSVAGGRARTQEVALPVNYKTLAQGQNLPERPGDQARRRDRGAVMIPQRETMSHFVTAGLTLLAPVSALAQPAPAARDHRRRDRAEVALPGVGGRQLVRERLLPRDGPERAAWSTTRPGLARARAELPPRVRLVERLRRLHLLPGDRHLQPGHLRRELRPRAGRLRPRTQFQVGQTYDRSNTRALRSLDPEGLPLPTSGHRHCGDERPTHPGPLAELAARPDGAFHVEAVRRRGPRRGRAALRRAELARELGKHGTAYLGYGYSSAWYPDSEAATTRVHRPSSASGTEGARGASSSGAASPTSRAWGGGTRRGTRRFRAPGRRTAFALRYNRDFGQAFGYGRQMIGGRRLRDPRASRPPAGSA